MAPEGTETPLLHSNTLISLMKNVTAVIAAKF